MPNLLTRKEAAARLGITVMTLDAERSSGHLAYIQRRVSGPRDAPGTAGHESSPGAAPS